MPAIDRQSVRDEFDRLKGEFDAMAKSGNLSSETRALFNALMMLFEVLMAVFMEKRTRKGSRNASIPPSQTGPDESAVGHPGAKGKGHGQNDMQSRNRRTVTTTTLVTVDECETCGTDLTDTRSLPYQRRTRIDIIFEKVVNHTDVEVKDCQKCGKRTTAPFPAGLSGPLQYGDGIKAYVLNLLIAQMVSLDRVQKSIKTLIGVVISQATILKFVTRLAAALERWESEAIEELLKMPVLHADETSLRVDRKNHWIHVYSGGDLTVKRLHRKRGCEAIKDIGIIPRYGGVVVHDCWASYLSYDHCGHALCGSHLLRELQFIVDSNKYAWATNMKRLLQETCTKVSEREDKRVTDEEYAALRKRYRNILTRGSKELPPIPAKPKSRRGRVAKSDAHNLLERLQKHEVAVLLFANDKHVPFTNNRAERDLRMSKVKQKVSGCFRTEPYADAYCRISSYLQTMGIRGYNPLVAIQLALSGELYEETGE